MTAAKRLPSVAIANLRGGDPRAIRRFVTTLGDGLREAGGVAVEGVEAQAGALDELLGAVAEYFGVAPGTLLVGDIGGGAGDVVAELVAPEPGMRLRVGGRGAAVGAVVFLAGPGLAALTGGVLSAAGACDGVGSRVGRRAHGLSRLADFDAP